MTRAAGALLAGLALCAGCATRPPAGTLRSQAPAAPFSSGFTAKASGGARARVTGLVAVDPSGRLRVEIPGPGGSVRLIIVANRRDLTVALGSDHLYYKGPSDDPILGDLFGVSMDAGSAAAAVSGTRDALPDGCEARQRRWRALPAGGGIPTRIVIACAGSRLAIRLSKPRPLAPPADDSAFASLELPRGFREAGRAEILDALTRGRR